MKPNSSCIILAGGLGTRLRSAVPDVPKCLAPVGGTTFLAIQMAFLRDRGVNQFVIATGYLSAAIEEAVRKGPFDVRCVVEATPLGTGGALLNAMHQTGLDEALVANGDTYIEADLERLAADLSADEAVRIGLVWVKDRSRYGGVSVEDGKISGFVEKGTIGPGYINAGYYKVSRAAFRDISPGRSFSLESDVLPKLVKQTAVGADVLAGDFIDIGVPQDYSLFCAKFS